MGARRRRTKGEARERSAREAISPPSVGGLPELNYLEMFAAAPSRLGRVRAGDGQGRIDQVAKRPSRPVSETTAPFLNCAAAPFWNLEGDLFVFQHVMEPDRLLRAQVTGQVSGQLAGDGMHLQRLQAGLSHTKNIINLGLAAFVESRKLLSKIELKFPK